jgi:hypothetical protein
LFYLFREIARHCRLLPWRESIGDRNELIRSTALHMIDNNMTDISRVKRALRIRVGYHDMGKEDQVLFRQHTRYLKSIVTGWSFAHPDDQEAFRTGAIPPSTLASRIRAAREAGSE